MKVITRVTICMRTNKVLEEESFEYNGPVAQCGGGGGGTRTQYESSPEQRALLQTAMPVLQQVQHRALAGMPMYEVPQMPAAPDVSTVPGPVLPTQQYFQGIAPQIQQALWQPYQAVAEQGLEMLGARGQLGSPRAGPSGAAAAYMGQFAAEAAPRLAAQAWQMGAPEMQRYGQQAFDVGQMMPYRAALGAQQQQLQAMQAPYNIMPSFLGGAASLTPTGITTPTGSGAQTGMLGMGAGALAGLGASLIPGIGIGAMPLMLGGALFGGGFGGMFG